MRAMPEGRHPFFTSPLTWFTDLDEARREAESRKQRVFVAHGHRHCSGTRALVERTLAKEELEEFVRQHFVAVASDSDAPSPALASIVAALPKHEPTPVCIYLSAAGRVLLSTAGGRPPAVLLNDMMQALAHDR
jgi:hypothetical protein